ncbi:glycoside hydrolase family 3 N-terminal domain-containing protein [Ruminococcus sp.]|uniref:glycoside hydrolase family 3 N-terminal domain-containing protein n=1 Tax=Ruminococcus sp. TaxID=41978 RepID=UPI0025FAF299|nr:glycoside hydrolase family 3 N-terminal domain-containing protein [Ruminococcus sp.]MBQ8965217.1 glycoside hydrolase [Ruminococcus sp.]
MKRSAIAVLAICMAFTATACGNIGRPDPKTITKKSGSDTVSTESKITTDEEDITVDVSSEPDVEVVPEVYSPEDDTEAFVDATMKNMTLEEKVGQLFFVRADALETGFEASVVNNDDIGGVTFVDKMMEDALDKYHVGGVQLFEKNIVDEEQLKKMTADLQDKSALPLFIGVEEIGGDYAPVANNMNFNVELFDNMNVIGASASEDKAKSMGKAIGGYLVSYGVNVDFAPVADVSVSSDSVSDSNFSAEPLIAASLVKAEIDGLHEGGVMTAVNHFPNYADGNANTDKVLNNGNSWEYMLDNELLPYINILDTTDMLMVGHVDLPSVVSDGWPASMSQDLIEGKVRGELGYDGVIITDSMSAKSVRKNYVQRECAVEAIIAGADIVLTPYDLDEAFDSVMKAVEDGKISEGRIDESVKRILTLKAENGLFG